MIKKILKWVIGLILIIGLFLGIYMFTVISNTPKINPNNIYDYLSESSAIYDDTGTQIENIYLDDGNRTNIDYKDMPESLVNAVVAIEDKTFWSHSGFNFWRMLGAIKDAAFNGGQIGGTSTITQQLARNVYLPNEKSVRSLARKISEAYYTVLLEKELSKEEIAEAYLNTVYLGYNCYGIENASMSYFNKEPKELNLAQCVALASMPKAPDKYALVKRITNDTDATVAANSNVIFETNEYKYVYNGDASKERREQTLYNMLEQDLITKAEYDEAIAFDLKNSIKITTENISGGTSYFTDYMIDEITDDLMEKYDYTKSEATKLIYTGGLKIYSTMNSVAQKAIEDGFANSYNFPNVANLNYDGNGNILGEAGNIMLYSYNNYFTSDDSFILHNDEYKLDDNGNMTIFKNNRLNFYKTEYNDEIDYNIEFKEMFKYENGILYYIKGGIILVPKEYKTLDDDGNMIISKDFFKDKTYFDESKDIAFFKDGSDGLILTNEYYNLRSKIREPQSAMVITDYKNGDIKGMVGGRDTVGKKLYNRAINPRQPGSSIKPLSVYSSALQQGADAAATNTPMSFVEYDKNQKTQAYGDYWTAASGINDAELIVDGKVWPKNWYSGYRGMMTFRKSLEQSVNVNAVRIFQQVGADYSISQLKKYGVTTVDEEGSTSDENAAALALGGMTRGISPLQMATAYGAFPNEGKVEKSRAYTKVEDKNGKVLLEPELEETQVIDPGVAFIMQDMLRTTVTNGIAGNAKVSGQVTAGKTGTTSDQKDIWFCGFTPQYAASIWMGNDMNMQLSSSSSIAASTWSKIMTNATSGLSGSLSTQPSNVVFKDGEYFVDGTQNGVRGFISNDEAAKQLEEKIKDAKKQVEDELKNKTDELNPSNPEDDSETISPDPTNPNSDDATLPDNEEPSTDGSSESSENSD